MKKLMILFTFYVTLTVVHAAEEPFGGGGADDSEPAVASRDTNVRVTFTTDLVEDFPIALTAVTTGEYLRFTLGPKDDGYYCTIYATIVSNDDGTIVLTTEFSEETEILQSDGSPGMRTVGFDTLSVVLAPGDERTLFSSGERTFVVGFLEEDD